VVLRKKKRKHQEDLFEGIGKAKEKKTLQSKGVHERKNGDEREGPQGSKPHTKAGWVTVGQGGRANVKRGGEEK